MLLIAEGAVVVGEEMAIKGSQNLAVSPEAHRQIAEFCRRNRMGMRSVASDVLLWFCGQPAAARRAILGVPDEDDRVSTLYAEILERLAADIRRSEAVAPTPPGKTVHDIGQRDTKGRKGEVARGIRRGRGPGPSAIPDPDNSVSNHR
jgi:hypothetical protein